MFDVHLLFLKHVSGLMCIHMYDQCSVSFSSGYVCERKDLLVNGCCNVNSPSSSQYVCKSCLANGCCSIYEFCVSCCLQPDKVSSFLLLFIVSELLLNSPAMDEKLFTIMVVIRVQNELYVE